MPGRLKRLLGGLAGRAGRVLMREETDRMIITLGEPAAYLTRAVADLELRVAELARLVGAPGGGLTMVEVAYALRVLGDVPILANVVEVQAGRRGVSPQLTALGYAVSTVEASMVVPAGAEPHEEAPLPPAGSADVVIALSSLDRLGPALPAGGLDDPAAAGLSRLRGWLRPGGRLVFSLAAGRGFRDRDQLERLLAGWEVERVDCAVRDNGSDWRLTADWSGVPEDGIALVVARA